MNTKAITVVGARPQFIKCAVVSRHFKGRINEIIIHTGQHYDGNMSGYFFDELKIPKPKYNLGIGGKSNAQMTAEMMLKLEKIFEKEKPAVVITYGDTDSTLAAALTAAKLYIPLVHIESGERIYQKKFVPEEINRVIVDHICDLNICSSRDAVKRLEKEGLNNAVFTGDPMYDLFVLNRKRIQSFIPLMKIKYKIEQKFVILTVHRLENTVNEMRLLNILKGLSDTGFKIIWPIHPRTKLLIDKSTQFKFIKNNDNFKLLSPLPYAEFNALLSMAHCALTDSGGVIRESYFAGKFSLVPLKNSWWKNIIKAGWSFEVNDNAKLIRRLVSNLPDTRNLKKPLLFGNGKSSLKVVKQIVKLTKNI